MWFIGVEVEQETRRVHPLLKKILDPPLQSLAVVDLKVAIVSHGYGLRSGFSRSEFRFVRTDNALVILLPTVTIGFNWFCLLCHV